MTIVQHTGTNAYRAHSAQPPTNPRTKCGLGTSETVKQHETKALTPAAFKARLWDLQRTMWKVTEDKTLAGCGRWVVDKSAGVSLVWQAKGKARWGGLQNSHSVWGSPVASAVICSRRAKEVDAAIQAWANGAGLTPAHYRGVSTSPSDRKRRGVSMKPVVERGVSLMTLTLRHNSKQSLSEVWDAITGCWQAVINTAAWRGGARTVGDKRYYGIAHWYRAVEVTHGKNGWHVHLHTVLFHDHVLSIDERDSLAERVFSRWAAKAVRLGMRAPSRKRGVDVVHVSASADDAKKIGAYTCKGMLSGMSGLAAEATTGQITKQAKGDNRTPFQVLGGLGEQYTKRDHAIWLEWEKESKGRRQTAWSRGTKDALGVNELADELINESLDDVAKSETVAMIDREAWKVIASDVEKRTIIVDAVSSAGSAESARKVASEYLRLFEVEHRITAISMAKPDLGSVLPTHRVAFKGDLYRAVFKDLEQTIMPMIQGLGLSMNGLQK